MTHICISKLTIIGSDNGLLPGWCQTIIQTNAGLLLIGTLGTNLIKIYTFSFNKMHLKMLPGKWQPFCLRPSVLIKLILSFISLQQKPLQTLEMPLLLKQEMLQLLMLQQLPMMLSRLQSLPLPLRTHQQQTVVMLLRLLRPQSQPQEKLLQNKPQMRYR